MNILGIDTSCDETAVAVVRDGREIVSNCIASQIQMHELYGGVVPEIAARKHIETIYGLTDRALAEAGLSKQELDAVAVTFAPGLIGALLVGLNFGKSLAFGLGLPLIPVHHVRGHIAACYLAHADLEPPFVCLCVSGGTSLLVEVRGYTDIRTLGTSRDDAAGECFDKVARALGLGYPGGAVLDRLSQQGDENAYALPRAQIKDAPFDMSFSGLKPAAINLIHNAAQKGESPEVSNLAASLVKAVSDSLVPRTMLAARHCGCDRVAVVGGVAANSRIRRELEDACKQAGARLFLPPLSLCGDNAAMIAGQGYYELLAGTRADTALNAYANRDIGAPFP